jgi:uncharacterized protein (TIGR02246 family)
MQPTTPEQVHVLWREATNAGDLEAIVALYEPQAAIVNTEGELLEGLDAVRHVTEGLLQLKPTFELRVERVLRCGDVALLLSPWTMSATAEGTPMTLQGTTTDLVRRQPDGTWRFVIDNPTGLAILGPEA